MANWFQALQKTAQQVWHPVEALLHSTSATSATLSDDVLEQLEATLLKADVGLPTTLAILDELQARAREGLPSAGWLGTLQQAMAERLLPPNTPEPVTLANPSAQQMLILLVVGVNGAGKTTLIGKLAHRYRQAGFSVIIGAADTFRAAADEQLAIWAERAHAPLVRLQPGTDPAAVVYQTLTQAKANHHQVVILDTAGRLQNQANLMEQLAKLRRVLDRERPADSVVESLLVLDASTGQNGLQQAKLFQDTVGLTGVALTKLDGSAKGGVVLAITQEYGLPVKLVGLGEGLDDLAPFDPDAFLQGILGSLAASP